MNIADDDRLDIFTFSNDEERKKARYGAQCPKKTCESKQTNLNNQLGRTSRAKLTLQCDEFPWKSSEQGGDYMDQLGPRRRTQTCVPAYQNNWHGQCVSELTLTAMIIQFSRIA